MQMWDANTSKLKFPTTHVAMRRRGQWNKFPKCVKCIILFDYDDFIYETCLISIQGIIYDTTAEAYAKPMLFYDPPN